MTLNKNILVPWDFSIMAEYALQHALKYAKVANERVSLLHIVKKKKDVSIYQKKLQEKVDKLKKETDVELVAIIKVGSIFTGISKVAEEISASLIIMGTHGIRGMQKITGSWALKVNKKTKVPFVIVQAPPASAIKNIVFPMDFKKENLEKLQYIDWLINYYKTKVHVCYQAHPDSRLTAKTKLHVLSAKHFLNENNANFKILNLPGKTSLAEEAIELSKEINANMIVITTTKKLGFHDVIWGRDEQQIIMNKEKIPVMCINPMKGSHFVGFVKPEDYLIHDDD